MMRALGLSSGVRTQKRPFGWICIIWFISSLDVTVGNKVDVQTMHAVLATCGDNVTLTCEVTGILNEEDITELYWMEKEVKHCKFPVTEPTNNTQFLCENRTNVNYISFNLTIMNITPNNKGTYHCKLRSKGGSANGKTIVRIEDCLDKSGFSVSESETECTFSGVYPPGRVDWTLGDTKLTDVKTTMNLEADGRYTIKSKAKKKKESTNELYSCSLFLPTNSSTEMQFVKRLEFSGSGVVRLTWICMLVEMVLLILVSQF